MSELIPAPFPHLVRRMLREAEHEQKIFDLPARRFWRGSPDLDLSVTVHGHRVAKIRWVPRSIGVLMRGW